MVLKGYVKRVEELKKKTKEQLINYIIDKERKRDDKLNHFVSRVVSLEDIIKHWKGENCKLRISIATLQLQLEISEKEKGWLLGEIKFKERDLSKTYEIISNHSKNIEKEVLMKFNKLKSRLIHELVEDKVQVIKEELSQQKEKEILEIFEYLGISKERLMEIIKK